MRIAVRLFAGLREALDLQEIEVDLPDGANVGDLRAKLGSEWPKLGLFLPSLVCAVNQEYRDDGFVLHEGDEVALIPPISGGRHV